MPIRFKVYDEDREYIDRALADAGLGPTVDAQVRLTLERKGLPAAIGHVSGAKVAQRFKAAAAAAGDEFDQLGQQFAAAGRTQALQAGSDRATITAHMRGVISQLATPQKTTKATKVDPLIAAIQSGGNWDGR